MRRKRRKTKRIKRNTINTQVDKINIRNARNLGTDLVEADYFLGCCSECAKYRGRIFSISGKDKRFPKKPTRYGCTCQGLTFSPFIYGVDEPMYYPKGVNIIKYSNRPFIDDRTQQEKEDYAVYRKSQDNEKWFKPYASRISKLQAYDFKCYNELKKILPEIAPKSLQGYRRMKNSNSKNYQKISQIALEKGLNLNYPEDMQREYEELEPIRKQYNHIKAECEEYWRNKRNNNIVDDISFTSYNSNSFFESLKRALKNFLNL